MDAAIERLNAGAGLIVPEIILLATACVCFLIGPFLVGNDGETAPGLRHRWGALSLVAIGSALAAWLSQGAPAIDQGPFRSDDLLWFVRGATLAFGALLALVLWNQTDDARSAESHACLLAIVAGTSLVPAANDLVGLFLALELVSIPTYVLLYVSVGHAASHANQEATLKYFLLSVFSSALTLYGLAWLFGLCGTTNLAGIAAVVGRGGGDSSLMIQLATGLLIAGLGFRVAAVPFHFYAPDVFQGCSPATAAMLSSIPKLVGFAALIRLLPLLGGSAVDEWVASTDGRSLLSFLAAATMTVGNLMALRQRNLYRLMAYSSVAHAGYMLVGLAVGNGAASIGGLPALLFYLATYGVVTIGAFALFASAGGRERLRTTQELAGLSRTQPLTALLLAVCLFSLTGLPPTAGFLGKLNLFVAATSAGTQTGMVLAAFLAVNAAVAAWYYLRLIATMYLEPPAEPQASRPFDPQATLVGIVCAAATIAVFLQPQWLWDGASQAARGSVDGTARVAEAVDEAAPASEILPSKVVAVDEAAR